MIADRGAAKDWRKCSMSMLSDQPHPAGTHYGRFADGRNALAADAKVVFGSDKLRISVTGAASQINWPYRSLRAAEPLRSHAIDVLLSSPETPGATLFVPGSAFASELKIRAPHLTARRESWRQARPWIAAALVLTGALATAIYGFGWSPAQSLANTLPKSWRARLGEQVIVSMTDGHKRCSDAAGLAALETLKTRLANAAPGNTLSVELQVFDWPLLNAFAVPGGKILVTKGLIDAAESPDELAGVLAHEMGHSIKLHPEVGIVRAVGLGAAVEIMMGGSGGTLANIGLLLAQLSYTRSAEREADAVGLKLLKDAGISPQGLGDFFKRISDKEQDQSKSASALDILRSHPPIAERAELVRSQGSYAATPALDTASWEALKKTCGQTKASASPDAGGTGPPE